MKPCFIDSSKVKGAIPSSTEATAIVAKGVTEHTRLTALTLTRLKPPQQPAPVLILLLELAEIMVQPCQLTIVRYFCLFVRPIVIASVYTKPFAVLLLFNRACLVIRRTLHLYNKHVNTKNKEEKGFS